MEIAVIADVHSNLPALEAVFREIEDREVFCCGDLVGYYPYPNEVLDLLREKKVNSVMGNHDAAVLKKDIGWLNPSAAEAVNWTLDVVSDENISYLSSLKTIYEGEDFKAVHGSPRDFLHEYVYPEYHLDVLNSFLGGSKTLILAHTHLPFVKHLEAGLVFNPGSVGQPRDGDPRASYALFDPERQEISIKRISYDIDRVAIETEKQGLPKGLSKRLFRGE